MTGTQQKHEEFNLLKSLDTIVCQIYSYLDKKFAVNDLSRGEWQALACLCFSERQVTQKEIKEYLGVDGSHTTKILDRLEKKMIIERHLHPKDKRIRLITVTPQSEPLASHVRLQLENLDAHLMSAFDSDESNLFKNCLKKINLPSTVNYGLKTR